MLRTHTCGELRLEDVGTEVSLCGWVQRRREFGPVTFLDLRDRYGITQIVFDQAQNADLLAEARNLAREFVIRVTGKVSERSNKNPKLPTGDVEIIATQLEILNPSLTPPFTIEAETDGGEELRMRYRYLDLRRDPVKNNLLLRHRVAKEVRNYLDSLSFTEVETPVLIKSTPEGARDFVVPSRMNPGQYYALPQSPQTFKQLLMVSGFDRYYQIVKCFRDEDLRADRQPEFTQIDCEMSFVEQEDVLNTFEGMMRHLLKEVNGVEVEAFPRMSFDEAMRLYGNDKPDIRFEMLLQDVSATVKGKGFKVFDDAELVLAIVAEGAADYTRKQIDELTDWVKRPQIGAKGLIYCRCNEDGSFKSSVDKFFPEEELKSWAEATAAKNGDLILVLSGSAAEVRRQMSELRLEMGKRLGLRNPEVYKPLWVTDFPLVEWDEDSSRWHAMHHPFTAPKAEDKHLMDSDPAAIRANAYDMVINGVEIGGGSVRIHNRDLQLKMLRLLGFSDEAAREQFGFLMGAFEYGAPPHAGIALGFDRLCALLGGSDSIRDYIAFPKNNMGRDTMIDAPSEIDADQLKEIFGNE
jgi:aspartyl-tRNA synthetase